MGKKDKTLELEQRPWGKFMKFADNEKCTVKILEIKPGEGLSFQSHKHRQETWYVICGKASVSLGPVKDTWEEIEPLLERIELSPGERIIIGRQMVHSAENTGDEPCLILEVSRGEFREHDEIRWKDRYTEEERLRCRS